MKIFRNLIPLYFISACCIAQKMLPADSLLFEKAVRHYAQSKFDSSLMALVPLVEKDVQYAPVYYYSGLNLCELNAFETAESLLLSAIKIDSLYTDVYSELAFVYIQTGNYGKAKEFASTAIRLDSTFAKGYINLASAHSHLGENDEFEKYLFKAAAIDPDQVANLGNTMLMQHNNPEWAKFYYSIVLSVHPTHLISILNIGQCEKLLGNEENALAYFKAGYDNLSDDHEMFKLFYSTYFRYLLDLNKLEEIYEHAMKKVANNNYSSAHYFLALANFKDKNMQEFKKHSGKYFELTHERIPENLEEWATEIILKKY